MEENEALLEEDKKLRFKNSFKSYSYDKNDYCDSPDSSADESVGWWVEESHSSCNTSCSGLDSLFSVDWKSEIDANGELFYVESEEFEEASTDCSKSQNLQANKKELACENYVNSRKGKFKSWIKRNRAKRRKSKSSNTTQGNTRTTVSSEPVDAAETAFGQKWKEIVLRLEGFGNGADIIERTLGLKTFYSSESQKFFITGFANAAPLHKLKDVNIGDVLLSINNERLSSENTEYLFESLKFPTEVVLTIGKNLKNNSTNGKKKFRSPLAQSLATNTKELEKMLQHQVIGVVFIHLKSQCINQKELVFSFPAESVLTRSLGSFVTLHHLSPDIALKNKCDSSSAYFKNRLSRVYYVSEGEYLLLITIPGSRCTSHEGSYIISDLIKCLLFNHQTLYRCFKCTSHIRLNHFFGVFFSRLLTSGFLANASRSIALENIVAEPSEKIAPFQFEELLQYVESVPLPKEVKSQLDDLLSEVEANYDSEEEVKNIDFDESFEESSDECDGDEVNCGGDDDDDDGFIGVDNNNDDDDDDDDDDNAEGEAEDCDSIGGEKERIKFGKGCFVIGSCIYHKGYLLASHFLKDDLLNVHSFFRQNGLIQLFRNEPVKSLVIWREVYPSSSGQDRNNEFCLIPHSFRRWFLIIIGQGYDSIIFILELHGYGGKFKKHLHTMIRFIEYGEEKLRHLKKSGISKLASFWLSDRAYSKTITTEEYFSFKKNKKTDFIMDIIKSADETQKSLGSDSPSLMELKQSNENILVLKSCKLSYGETSEDSASQAPSNQSEISDENAPILGRRAERNIISPEVISDESENSDSDWESFQDLTQRDYASASGTLLEPKILKDSFSSRSRLTTGVENFVFHFLHFNECEGILIAPALILEETSSKLKEIIENFRRSAQVIHSLLDNNVRFKKNSEDGSKSFINKSLVAVKEHGLLLRAGTILESENINKKNGFLQYWVIGRLFFTPHRREIYICHSDDAPQNLVEIGFRLGLS